MKKYARAVGLDRLHIDVGSGGKKRPSLVSQIVDDLLADPGELAQKRRVGWIRDIRLLHRGVEIGL
jgi:hypothetical protein